MKTVLKKALLLLLSSVILVSLLSCGSLFSPKKLSGIYGEIDEKGFGYTYVFDGDEVTYYLWSEGESFELMSGKYEIGGGKIKIISDEYFKGCVSEDGKYVTSKSFSSGTDENGNEYVKIGISSFNKMEEEELPTNPDKDPGENPENPDENPEEDPDEDPEKNPEENENSDTQTTVTVSDLKTALTNASKTENASFEASYKFIEVYKRGTETDRIEYYMELKANGTDRYLKFKIETLDSGTSGTHGDGQIVEIWYKGSDTYIKAETWQKINDTTTPKEVNTAKASGQTFSSVCQSLAYPTSSILTMGSDLNALLSDTGATATKASGKITYALDCTGKTDVLNSLYRMSKAFAVGMLSDSFSDADVNYSVGSSSGVSVTYSGEHKTPDPSENATFSGEMSFKSATPTISVPSSVSSAEEVGSGYKSWYDSIDNIIR